MSSMNSWIFGGQPGIFSARTLVRCARSSYGQQWMMRFNGPTSVWKKAPSGDTLVRSFSPSANRFSTSGIEPGFIR